MKNINRLMFGLLATAFLSTACVQPCLANPSPRVHVMLGNGGGKGGQETGGRSIPPVAQWGNGGKGGQETGG